MDTLDVVVDTNVLVSGLMSLNGASHRFLAELGRHSKLIIHVSVPLILEYEEVLKRQARMLGLTYGDIDDLLDYICSISKHHEIFYLWRPYLNDINDDMLLELAVESRCKFIVTFNHRDFEGINRFGVETITPKAILDEIGELL
jgi:putative PIN family toxin of toxin-antitoxin system